MYIFFWAWPQVERFILCLLFLCRDLAHALTAHTLLRHIKLYFSNNTVKLENPSCFQALYVADQAFIGANDQVL